ncbi:uncharacterized protein LOC107984004 [Homo sapiens]|uniref:uncharacterized protein LOC107984004 n=1 Tax=Homo sapiens TaxID=9606 RepID=UPI001FB19382|nr:uncharacterized protein LOC107984004 [Homo sapiens]
MTDEKTEAQPGQAYSSPHSWKRSRPEPDVETMLLAQRRSLRTLTCLQLGPPPDHEPLNPSLKRQWCALSTDACVSSFIHGCLRLQLYPRMLASPALSTDACVSSFIHGCLRLQLYPWMLASPASLLLQSNALPLSYTPAPSLLLASGSSRNLGQPVKPLALSACNRELRALLTRESLMVKLDPLHLLEKLEGACSRLNGGRPRRYVLGTC